MCYLHRFVSWLLVQLRIPSCRVYRCFSHGSVPTVLDARSTDTMEDTTSTDVLLLFTAGASFPEPTSAGYAGSAHRRTQPPITQRTFSIHFVVEQCLTRFLQLESNLVQFCSLSTDSGIFSPSVAFLTCRAEFGSAPSEALRVALGGQL